jgi:hypothetical protein
MKSRVLHKALVYAESECIESLKENLCVVEFFVHKYNLAPGGIVVSSNITELLLRSDLGLSVDQLEILETYGTILMYDEKYILYLLGALLGSIILGDCFTKVIFNKYKTVGESGE